MNNFSFEQGTIVYLHSRHYNTNLLKAKTIKDWETDKNFECLVYLVT